MLKYKKIKKIGPPKGLIPSKFGSPRQLIALQLIFNWSSIDLFPIELRKQRINYFQHFICFLPLIMLWYYNDIRNNNIADNNISNDNNIITNNIL